jgi:hypothetical protein
MVAEIIGDQMYSNAASRTGPAGAACSIRVDRLTSGGARDDIDQTLGLHGLRHVGLESCGERSFAVFRPRVRRDRNHRHFCQAGVTGFPKASQECVSSTGIAISLTTTSGVNKSAIPSASTALAAVLTVAPCPLRTAHTSAHRPGSGIAEVTIAMV